MVDLIVLFLKKEGISEASVDNSLERLMRNGSIFQPSASSVSLV